MLVMYKIEKRGKKYWDVVHPLRGWKATLEIRGENLEEGKVYVLDAEMNFEKNRFGTKVTGKIKRVITEVKEDRVEDVERIIEGLKKYFKGEYEENERLDFLKGLHIATRERGLWDYIEVLIEKEKRAKVKREIEERFKEMYEEIKRSAYYSKYEESKILELSECLSPAEQETIRVRLGKLRELSETIKRDREEKNLKRVVEAINKLETFEEILKYPYVFGDFITKVPIYNWKEIYDYDVSPDDWDEHIKGYRNYVDYKKLLAFLKRHGLREDLQEKIEKMFETQERIQEEEKKAQEKETERRKLVEKITNFIKNNGEKPEGMMDVATIKTYHDTFDIYGGGERIVEDKEGYLWYILNNGGDGDYWKANNVRTSGAGAIGWRIKREKAKEIEDLLKELKELT